MRIKSIDPLSYAKVFGVMQGITALIFSGIFGVLIVIDVISSPLGHNRWTAGISLAMGLGMLIIWPIMNCIVGVICGLLSAVIYNFAVKFVGGIKVNLE